MQKIPFLIGRLFFGGFFLYNGIEQIKKRNQLAQYASAKHVPQPDVAVILSGALLMAGGTSLILGYKPKLGAAAIATFLAAVSPAMHDFWSVQDPNQRTQEMINFSKNLALLGASLALAGVEEPWPAALPEGKPSSAGRVLKSVKQLVA
jgi:uncharacterized membrane protein YphA (DoxX/SURF4 family)